MAALFTRLVVGIVLALLCGASGGRAYAQQPERPNIVLIYSDDQGYGDVGVYGSSIPTPHLDQLARDGARFTDFYVAAPVCTPSRYALLTGRHPSRAQRLPADHALMPTRPQDYQERLTGEEVTLAQLLKQRGYRSALVGKWHLGLGFGGAQNLPTHHGFDTFYGFTAGCIDYFTLRYGILPDWWRDEQVANPSGYATDVITDEAVRYIQDASSDRPFFLYLPYNAPHYGKGWDEQDGGFRNILQAKPEDLERVQHIEGERRRTYAAMVQALDDGVGRVLAALDAAHLRENTWVIFISDNGGAPDYGGDNGPLRGAKATLWEGGVRVPAMMRWPEKIEPGTVIDQPLSTLDLLPSISALLQLDAAELTLDGRDMRPALFEGARAERTLFWDYRGSQALRRGPWKYIQQEDGPPMLFNLEDDLGEQHDRARQHPEVLRQLQQLYQQQEKEMEAKGR